MLNIKDKPGCISKAAMRQYFEGAIKQTPSFASNTPLDAMVINDEFSHYLNADTDTMWLGFVLGMRCAERAEKARAAATAAQQTDLRAAAKGAADALDCVLSIYDPRLTQVHCECEPDVGYQCPACRTPSPEIAAGHAAVTALRTALEAAATAAQPDAADAFEAWARTQRLDVTRLDGESGQYLRMSTERAWNGWQARAALAAATAAQPARQPLTPGQIFEMSRAAQDQAVRGIAPSLHLARAVEAHHNIGTAAGATGASHV